MRREAQEEQASGVLFEDPQERHKCTTKEKGALATKKGTRASNNNKKTHSCGVYDQYQPPEQNRR